MNLQTSMCSDTLRFANTLRMQQELEPVAQLADLPPLEREYAAHLLEELASIQEALDEIAECVIY